MYRSGLVLVVVGASFHCLHAEEGHPITLKRTELQTQVHLYNGWMRHLFGPRSPLGYEPGDAIYDAPDDFLSPDRVVSALVGQNEKRVLSPDEVVELKVRLRQWIDLFAKGHFLEYDSNKSFLEPKPNINLDAGGIGLHFFLPTANSTLDNDLNSLAKKYASIGTQASQLAKQYDRIAQRVGENNKDAPYDKIVSLVASSDVFKGWLKAVEIKLIEMQKESLQIGYPIRRAIHLHRELNLAKSSLDDPFSLSQSLMSRLHSLSWSCEDNARLCRVMGDSVADPPPCLDFEMLQLAWASTVPLSYPTRNDATEQLQLYRHWLNDVGLEKYISLDGIAAVFPNEVFFQFSADSENGRNLFAEELDRRGTNERLFYKLSETFASNPPGMRMEFNPGLVFAFFWRRGELAPIRLKGGYSEREIKSDDLKQIMKTLESTSANESSDTKKLTAEFRSRLLKHLNGFGGKTQVLSDDPNLKSVRVSNSKNMVIEGENYWENVQVNLVLIPPREEQGSMRLLCFVDGRWSSGILQPKSRYAFRDMEPKYATDLTAFARHLLVVITNQQP